MALRKVKITSDGPYMTHVWDLDTGEEIECVEKMDVEFRVGMPPLAHITVMRQVEFAEVKEVFVELEEADAGSS